MWRGQGELRKEESRKLSFLTIKKLKLSIIRNLAKEISAVMRKNEAQNTRKFWKNTHEMAVSSETSEYFTKKVNIKRRQNNF